MDIVSKKLAAALNIDDDINDDELNNGCVETTVGKNPLTQQPIYSSSLVTEADIAAFKLVEEELGMEDFSKIVLMKTAQKSMNDHDELITIMSKVDDSKAARMAEVATQALANASDAAKALLTFTLQQQKLEIEKQKLEIKSITINNIGGGDGSVMNGTQKEIMDRIKKMINEDVNDDDIPPLING